MHHELFKTKTRAPRQPRPPVIRVGRTSDKILKAMRDGEWRSAAEIAERISSTPAAISNCLRLLMRHELLRREQRPVMGTGHQVYWYQITEEEAEV